MVKLTSKQRKVQRDHLQRRKNTLLKQGASSGDIRRLLGGYNFAGLSDNELSRLYQRSKQSKPVTVVDNKIVDKSYLNKLKAWYGVNFEPSKVSSSYAKSLNSKLNQFSTLKEIRAYKANLDKKAKERYLLQLERLAEKGADGNPKKAKKYNKIISKIRRMSRQNFKDFVSSDISSKVDFDAIYLIDSPTNKTDADYNDLEFMKVSELFSDLDRFSTQFISSRKR